MRSPLFWKIFLSFWLTTVIISQSSWFIYATFWDDRPTWEREISERLAPVELGAAAAAITRSGTDGLVVLRAALPDRGARLRIVTTGEQIDRINDRIVAATAPDGATVRLAYRLIPDRPDSFDLLATLYRSTDFLLASLLGGIVFAAVLAFYMMRPVRRLRDGFDLLAAGDLTVRLGPDMGRRRDEIADLARHFDHMARRLEQLVTVRDQLLHDVSHELRSPLARLNLATALLRRGPDDFDLALRRIDDEVSRLDELVTELLSLARSESDGQGRDEYFDLIGLVRSVVNTLEVEVAAKDVAIVFSPDTDECVVRGNSELIRRAIENVVRNAIRVSGSGDVIAITAAQIEATTQINISDEGPGVPEELLTTIFDPFQRGMQTNGKGYGLGLTIARRAILTHGGEIVASNLRPHGLRVSIRLPITALPEDE